MEPIMDATPDWLEDDTRDMESETWEDEGFQSVPPLGPLVSQPQSQSEGARYMGSGSSSIGRGLDEGSIPHHSSSSSRVPQFPSTSRGRHSSR